jgi:hypothetical protein
MINLYDLSLDELTDFVVELGEKPFPCQAAMELAL